jgi:pimeloyl-ACP methyl ester carboxylesterase
VGEARPFAEQLGKDFGVVEPFLLSESLEGQINDLKVAIERHADVPVVLIGHSYGAMLSYIFAARFPELIEKLILISSGVFESTDAEKINKKRLSRLTDEQKHGLQTARDDYQKSEGKAKNIAFANLFTLVQQADAYDLLPHENDLVVVRPALYESVWRDMLELRDSGELVAYGKDIQCPVVAIHGTFDPRSAKDIQKSLDKYVRNFRFILLERCGHYPWYEKRARRTFYHELKKNIG